MAWRIEFDSIADKELDKLDAQTARRIIKFLFERLAQLDDPRSLGEALKGGNRVGDYRVIADVQDGVICILVLRIGNRRDIYKR
jgi:mRNA interferase RelE/StbE